MSRCVLMHFAYRFYRFNRVSNGEGRVKMFEPWPWWVAGPLIGLAVPLMLLVGGKNLGISSSFRHLCAAILPKSTLEYLRSYDWRKESWSLLFVAGLALGGFVATFLLSSDPAPLLPPHLHNVAGALQLLGRRPPHRLRHPLCRRLHVRPQHHGPVQPPEGQPLRHPVLLRRRPTAALILHLVTGCPGAPCRAAPRPRAGRLTWTG